ncbi:MAG: hypothetical protein CL760_06570 [Chloroflexi bacterium]|nr:hypothetical protein [Chloroflexota bacterium]
MSNTKIEDYKTVTKIMFQEYVSYLNKKLNIHSYNDAIELFVQFKEDQIIKNGNLKGLEVSRKKYIALLSASIHYRDYEEYSMTEIESSWNLYWKIKDLGHI